MKILYFSSFPKLLRVQKRTTILSVFLEKKWFYQIKFIDIETVSFTFFQKVLPKSMDK